MVHTAKRVMMCFVELYDLMLGFSVSGAISYFFGLVQSTALMSPFLSVIH